LQIFSPFYAVYNSFQVAEIIALAGRLDGERDGGFQNPSKRAEKRPQPGVEAIFFL
jgi:hypothetical protein